mmetsp:Transcript_126997/g.270799  ORF Transcript_126997/g.270799 Transcript_126997/m.270799 type:complete len:203 (-) Transcript_126997:230-838(-)
MEEEPYVGRPSAHVCRVVYGCGLHALNLFGSRQSVHPAVFFGHEPESESIKPLPVQVSGCQEAVAFPHGSSFEPLRVLRIPVHVGIEPVAGDEIIRLILTQRFLLLLHLCGLLLVARRKARENVVRPITDSKLACIGVYEARVYQLLLDRSGPSQMLEELARLPVRGCIIHGRDPGKHFLLQRRSSLNALEINFQACLIAYS